MSKRLNLLLQILEGSPDDSFALFAIAKEYEGMGETGQARSWYERLRSTDPAYIGLYFHLAKLYESLSELPAALETYDAGIALARSIGNQHALNELLTARLGIADPDDDV